MRPLYVAVSEAMGRAWQPKSVSSCAKPSSYPLQQEMPGCPATIFSTTVWTWLSLTHVWQLSVGFDWKCCQTKNMVFYCQIKKKFGVFFGVFCIGYLPCKMAQSWDKHGSSSRTWRTFGSTAQAAESDPAFSGARAVSKCSVKNEWPFESQPHIHGTVTYGKIWYFNWWATYCPRCC